MSLTNYCSFGEIRAALGVNSVELGDGVLALPVYEMGIVRELNKISTSLTAAFSPIARKNPKSRTDIEAELHDAVRLFSVYAVAKQVGVSLATFAPKDVGDGKATVSRFAGEAYERTLKSIEAEYRERKTDLRAALDRFTGQSAGTVASRVVSPLRVVNRNVDVVTGE